jgi:hypothetical protein
MRRYRSLGLVALALVAAACGPRVRRLSLSDQRLPVEARRWLADAEDEVSIAAAERDQAQDSLRQAHDFEQYVSRDVNPRWPSSASASGARERLGQLVRERIRLAQIELDVAERRVALARARLVQTRAETAVRHDLASYELDPLNRAVAGAQRALGRTVEQAEAQRARTDEVTGAFWTAYAGYVRSGGRNDVLWGWQQ